MHADSAGAPLGIREHVFILSETLVIYLNLTPMPWQDTIGSETILIILPVFLFCLFFLFFGEEGRAVWMFKHTISFLPLCASQMPFYTSYYCHQGQWWKHHRTLFYSPHNLTAPANESSRLPHLTDLTPPPQPPWLAQSFFIPANYLVMKYWFLVRFKWKLLTLHW